MGKYLACDSGDYRLSNAKWILYLINQARGPYWENIGARS